MISLGADPVPLPYRHVQLSNTWFLPEVTLLSASRSRGTWELQPPTGGRLAVSGCSPGAKTCIPSPLPLPQSSLLSSPIPLSAQTPSLSLPWLLLAPPDLT